MGAVKFDRSKLEAVQGTMAEFAGLTTRIGIVGPGATALQEGSSVTLAELGLMFELGTERMPERAWLRGTLAARRADIAALRGRVLRAVLAGSLSPREGHDAIGLQIQTWLRAGIVAGIAPALAPSTIAAKGSSTPLIDDSQFINSITWEVVPTSAASP